MFAMFPRWMRTVASSSIRIVIFLIIFKISVSVISFLLTIDNVSKPRKPTTQESDLAVNVKSAMTNKTLEPANLVDVRKLKDKTRTNKRKMVPVLQSLQNPGTAGSYLTVEQYLKRVDKDNLRPEPVSSSFDNSIVVLETNKTQVPNVVHYIHFKAPNFTFGFVRYVAFLSVYKYIRPGLTIIWGNELPDKTTNEWWARTLTEFPNIYYVFKNPVKTIAGKTVDFVQHKSDWLRIHILLDYGGIYLDHDVFVLRPFTDLLKYPITMGRETPDRVSPGIILSAPQQVFLERWQHMYRQYRPTEYDLNSNRVLSGIAKARPTEVHILNGNFTEPYPHPSYTHAYELFCGNYDLTYNYAMHIYRAADFPIPANEEELAGYNCTLGNAMRTVLYDDPKVRSKQLANGCVTKN